MESGNKLMSQKEYLKKYLSKDKAKKKKKPKISSSTHLKRSVIIDDDDDLGLQNVASVDDDEFNLDFLGDEAPQIVGVIDERPAELIAKEKYLEDKWKNLDDGVNSNEVAQSASSNKAKSESFKKETLSNKNNDSDSDIPTSGKLKTHDISKKEDYKYEDITHKRSKEKKKRKQSSDSDMSPDRTSKRRDTNRNLKGKISSQDRLSKEKDSNGGERLMPTKKHQHYGDSDSDLTPPRRKQGKHSSKYKRNENTGKEIRKSDPKFIKSSHHNFNHNKYEKMNEKYKKEDKYSIWHHGKDSESKKSKHNSDSDDTDLSPPRKTHKHIRKKQKSPNHHKQGGHSDSDLSPVRTDSKQYQKDRLIREKLSDKTLDGKKSGLQDAKQLKEELKKLKEAEDKLLKKMDPSLLGKMAAPIVRDRKTGQVRNLAKEKQEEKVKSEKRAQIEKKYYKWGKGLKQIEESEERLADALHEMSKPLARYRDDKDLDAFLRAQEREGDPMLEYIRSKQTESHRVVDLTIGSSKPQYNGSYMPNRFGIRPGYRWDGVDRSNGYEKKWFEQKNARRAVEEEAYKWSTSDM